MVVFRNVTFLAIVVQNRLRKWQRIGDSANPKFAVIGPADIDDLTTASAQV
jgi:hypothetical protein